MNRSSLNPRHVPESILGERQTKSVGVKEIPDDLNEVIFLRLPKVKAVTGLSKSSLYDLIRANSFPAPIRLGTRTVAWVASEVNQWAAERILRSRVATPDVDGRRVPQRAEDTTSESSRKRA
jgi:prophage regulatory protein